MSTLSLAPRITLKQFEVFLKDNYSDVHPIFSKVGKIKKYVDIDGDGSIDCNDLEIFLKRYSKLEYAKS